MKAAVLTALLKMEIREIPDPQISAPDDVLLRIAAVGVCGSDVHYYSTGRIGSQVVKFPFVVGHEAAAVVAAVGPAVRDLRPGDRVAVEPAVSCLACDQCLAGRPHTCRKLKFLGCPGQLPGCLCELLVMPARCCVKLPEGMSLEEGALVEPLAIGAYAVKLAAALAGSLQDAKVGILGMGPIGSSVMLAARAAGAAAVYATDRLPARCAIAAKHGAAWVGNPDQDDVVGTVAARVPGLLDVVFECCGHQETLDQGIEMLRPGGRLLVVGIPEFDRFSFSAEQARRKELTLQHVRRQNGCVEAAIHGLASGALPAGFMVTHRFSLAAAPQAFDLVHNYADGVLKAMINF